MRDHGGMRDDEEVDQFRPDDAPDDPGQAGQSGDLQGLDSDDVTDLLEEGQTFEAGVLSGIENAPPADDGGIRTREVPEDDVPLEYLDDEQGSKP